MDDRIVVSTEQTGQLLVELADVLIEELQLLQEHLQQAAVDRL